MPVRRWSADTAACARDGSKGQSTRSRRACPVCRCLNPHWDVGALGQRSCPRGAHVAVDWRCPRRLHGLPFGGIESCCREQGRPVRCRSYTCRLLNLRRNRNQLGKTTPSGLRLTSVMPDTSSGGSFVHTDPGYGCIGKDIPSRERPGAASVPKHERPRFQVVPARLRFVVFRDIA